MTEPLGFGFIFFVLLFVIVVGGICQLIEWAGNRKRDVGDKKNG
jgi:hypothetical protein